MKAIIAIALILSLATVSQAAKCNGLKDVFTVIQTKLCPELWEVKTVDGKEVKGAQYNYQVVEYFKSVLNQDTDATVDITDEWKNFAQLKGKEKICVKTDQKVTIDGKEVVIKPYEDVFQNVMKEYIEEQLENKPYPQRILASLQVMVNDKCKKKADSTTLQNIRQWAKTYTFKDGDVTKSGTWLINEIYKYKIWLVRSQASIFRSIWALSWTGQAIDKYVTKDGQGAVDKFKIVKADFDAFTTTQQNAFKGYKKYSQAVLDMAKKYLETFGSTDCLGDNYYKKLETLQKDWVTAICPDDNCTKYAVLPLTNYNNFAGNDGAKINEIIPTGSKQNIEPSGRRVLTDDANDIVSTDTADTGIKATVDETLDAVKIGGVDKDGKCVEGTNCTTESPSPAPAPASTTSSSAASNATLLSVAVLAIIAALF